jgi:CheY-like chemotaxis protein
MSDSFDGLTVLVVEDDWLVREDIVTGLRQHGWRVLEADTGTGALKLLLETKIVHLLITDILLADATHRICDRSPLRPLRGRMP